MATFIAREYVVQDDSYRIKTEDGQMREFALVPANVKRSTNMDRALDAVVLAEQGVMRVEYPHYKRMQMGFQFIGDSGVVRVWAFSSRAFDINVARVDGSIVIVPPNDLETDGLRTECKNFGSAVCEVARFELQRSVDVDMAQARKARKKAEEKARKAGAVADARKEFGRLWGAQEIIP